MLKIRLYTPEDRKAIEDIIVNFQNGEAQWEDCFKPGEEMAGAWLDNMLKHGHIYVADDDKVVGYICFYNMDGENTLGYKFDKQLYVSDLYVVPEARKRGIGRQLLEVAERYGKMSRAGRMILNVLAKNKPAIEMYGRCGFRDYERVMVRPL